MLMITSLNFQMTWLYSFLFYTAIADNEDKNCSFDEAKQLPEYNSGEPQQHPYDSHYFFSFFSAWDEDFTRMLLFFADKGFQWQKENSEDFNEILCSM